MKARKEVGRRESGGLEETIELGAADAREDVKKGVRTEMQSANPVSPYLKKRNCRAIFVEEV